MCDMHMFQDVRDNPTTQVSLQCSTNKVNVDWPDQNKVLSYYYNVVDITGDPKFTKCIQWLLVKKMKLVMIPQPAKTARPHFYCLN